MLDTPVVMLTYRRCDSTRRVLEQIAKVRPRSLYVSSDGPRTAAERDDVLATRRLFDDVGWDCRIERDFSERNLGLALRTSTALSRAFERHPELIVLEDDTIPDPSFFHFCEQMLERYRDDPRVMQIKGTCDLPSASELSPYSYLFSRQIGPWGWASWKRVWDGFDTSRLSAPQARARAHRPRGGILRWKPVWRTVADDPALSQRVEACGRYYYLWMRCTDTGLIATSWAGLFSLSVLERDGVVVSPLTNLVTNVGFEAGGANYRDADHAMAERPTAAMRFPLSHPPTVEIDAGFQRRYARALDRGFLGRKTLEEKLAAARFRRRATPEAAEAPAANIPATAAGIRTSSLSFILEWENVTLSELDRTRRMFDSLFAQLRELLAPAPTEAGAPPPALSFDRDVEIIVGFDDATFSLEQVRSAVEQILPPLDPDWRLDYVSASGVDYYEIKNLGASRARGDLLVFLDSDVVPDPGWLRGVLAPLADPQVQLVSGHTYIEPCGLLAKTFALAWFFPLRAVPDGIRFDCEFYANNVVFRRELFDRFAFPAQLGTSRGACRNLTELLDREGVVGCRNPAARVSHPPPNGLKHFLIRGLTQGRDALLHRKHDAFDVAVGIPVIDTALSITRQAKRGFKRLVTLRDRVDLSPAAVPAALLIWTAFTAMQYLGLGLEYSKSRGRT